MKRALLVAAAAIGAAALFTTTASAKGPSAATIAGPGLEVPIALSGDAESNGSSIFGTIVRESGWFNTVFPGEQPIATRTRPKGDLGPRYVAVYTVPGPNRAGRLHQELYPYARPQPVAHMAAGQRFWDGRRTVGGWVRAHGSLRTALVAAGLPRTAPSVAASGLSAGTWAGIAAAGALGLLTLGSIAARRRPRRHQS